MVKTRYLRWSSHNKGMSTPPHTHTQKHTKNCWKLWTGHVSARNQAPKLWDPLPSAAFQQEISWAKHWAWPGSQTLRWAQQMTSLSLGSKCQRLWPLPPFKFILIPRHLFLLNFICLFFEPRRPCEKGSILKFNCSYAATLFLFVFFIWTILLWSLPLNITWVKGIGRCGRRQ